MVEQRNAVSISNFCRRNDVGRSKTYEEINSGRLKAKKFGRKTLIINEDEWLAGLPDLQLPATNGSVHAAGGPNARTS